MNFRWIIILGVGICMLLGGCASIPKESVQLSQEVGKGISSYHEAYINLLNSFFAQKRARIDDVVLNKYLPQYMDNIKTEMIAAGEDPEKLYPFMVRDIVKDVSNKSNEMHEELEKTRIALVDVITQDYLVLSQSNSTITGILQSAVDVKEAASSIKGTIESITGNKISFEKIENKFNEYLLDAGNLSSKGISLYESIKTLLDEIKEE